MSAPDTATEIAARIAAGTADCAWFGDMSCQLLADVVNTIPVAALGASPCRPAIVTRLNACLADEADVFGPGFWDRVALSAPADIIAAPFEADLPGTIGKIALTLLFVAAGFGMMLLGLRQLAAPRSAPTPTE